MINNEKYAFTLAEVLVTLSILGVVAAISIPNLIQSYKKQTTVSRLKMAYSMLDNLTQRSYIENGYPEANINMGSNLSGYDINENFNKYYGKYLNIAKECGIMTDSRNKGHGCFKDDTVKKLDGEAHTTGAYGMPWYYHVLLKNDMSLAVWGNLAGGNNGTVFAVDIDGPNRGDSKLGQDVFLFTYTNKCHNTVMILTGGFRADTCNIPSRDTMLALCKKNGTPSNWLYPNGSTCSALIIKDGWKISSDYPWDYAHKK